MAGSTSIITYCLTRKITKRIDFEACIEKVDIIEPNDGKGLNWVDIHISTSEKKNCKELTQFKFSFSSLSQEI